MSWSSNPKMTDRQKTKCLLLDIVIWQSFYAYTYGLYMVARDNGYVRPIGYVENEKHIEGDNTNSFVWSKTVEGCFDIALHPEKYSGHWTD